MRRVGESKHSSVRWVLYAVSLEHFRSGQNNNGEVNRPRHVGGHTFRDCYHKTFSHKHTLPTLWTQNGFFCGIQSCRSGA